MREQPLQQATSEVRHGSRTTDYPHELQATRTENENGALRRRRFVY
jgi:hypothetical protein